MDPLLITLTITACISPLLTVTHLWQMKEWRVDRLREHLRAEGTFRPIFGMSRPFIVAIGFITSLTFHVPRLTLHVLSIMVVLNILQILLHRQPRPIWTQKAMTLFSTALLLTIVVSFLIVQQPVFHISLILLPLLQPFFLFLSWLLWLPVDRMLKRHTLEEAHTLRAQYPDLIVIGITGSVGKTTTKELLAHILSDSHPLATPAYVNTEMGVANWLIQTLKSPIPNTQILIVEMGAYRKGEIRTLCKIVQPNIGVITTIGTQHLALFGSPQAVAEAKGELFQSLPKDGHAFVSANTPFLEELKKKAKCQVIECRIQNVECRIPIHSSSISLAVHIAAHLGMTQDQIDQKIQTFTPPPHTFAIRKDSGVTILDDTHNVSPESLFAAIEWAKMQPPEYKILMTPGIIELGPEENAIHQRLGEQASPVFNRVIFLNKRYANMFQKGYGKPMVEVYSKHSTPIPTGSLLVCIGRMSDKTIRTLLP